MPSSELLRRRVRQGRATLRPPEATAHAQPHPRPPCPLQCPTLCSARQPERQRRPGERHGFFKRLRAPAQSRQLLAHLRSRRPRCAAAQIDAAGPGRARDAPAERGRRRRGDRAHPRRTCRSASRATSSPTSPRSSRRCGERSPRSSRPARGRSSSTRAHRPFVILVVGVNGSGKTTTIGKLARRADRRGSRACMLAAGDTFRAAAIEQLNVWAERSGAGVRRAAGRAPIPGRWCSTRCSPRARGSDVLLADTAGRLHSQSHLMEELKKVKRVIQRVDPTRAARSAAGARCQPGPERARPGACSSTRPSVSPDSC